jgi:hypothetical protein
VGTIAVLDFISTLERVLIIGVESRGLIIGEESRVIISKAG